MKNKRLLASFVGLMVCFSCQKQTTEPIIEPEQKVFENIPTCCLEKDGCRTPVTLYNQIGRLYASGVDIQTRKLVYSTIHADQDLRESIADSILPIFKYYGDFYDICNMPENIKNSDRERKVRFDCKFIYVPKWWTGELIPQSGGYRTVLIRIEIID